MGDAARVGLWVVGLVCVRYRAPGVPWTEKFKHVVGICHTNYLVYSKALQGGNMKAAVLFFMNQWMCRAYCHKVDIGHPHTPLLLRPWRADCLSKTDSAASHDRGSRMGWCAVDGR